jgi:hypothetical protein
MAHINNIYGIRINNVSSNGSVNFGNVIHKGHSANSKSVGGQTVIGDSFNSSNNNFEKNIVSDPDILDQNQSQL